MKITRIKKLLLFILLGLLCASCNSEPNGKIVFKITWDKTEIYINEIVNVEIDANIPYEITNLTEDILEISESDSNKIEVKGIGIGEGKINVVAENGDSQVITITVNNYPLPTSLTIKLVEEGPYYYGRTYHLEYVLEPTNALKNIELSYNYNYMTINEETMEVTFDKAGEFYISCYSRDNMELESRIDFEVVYHPEDELYRILFVGNSLTKHNYNIPEIVEAMMKLDGLDVECEGSIAGGKSLVDQRSKVESNLRNFRYTHVVLQEHSYGPISKYDQFENTVIALAKKIEENKAKIILYQTWAYDKDIWNGVTKAEMTNKLVDAYDKVAEKVGASVNRAGEAFALYEAKSENWPSLYVDMNHPSVYGAYLSACVHYSSITGKKASENPYIMEGIDAEMLKNIKEIADEVVFKE